MSTRGDIESTVGRSEESPYTLYVNVTTINVGSSDPAVDNVSFKVGGAFMSGDMTLKSNATDEVICQMSFKKVKGA